MREIVERFSEVPAVAAPNGRLSRLEEKCPGSQKHWKTEEPLERRSSGQFPFSRSNCPLLVPWDSFVAQGRGDIEALPWIKFLAQRTVHRLPRYGHPSVEDLVNAGVIGLMDSLDKFDPEKTGRFKTYAEYRIKGAIGDELRSQDCVSRSSRLKAKRLKNSVERLQKENGRQVKDEELAEELGITLEAYYELANEVNEISSPDFEKIGERRSSSEGMVDFSPGKLKENPYYTVSQVELMNFNYPGN